MAATVANVSAAKAGNLGGAVSVAPYGTTLPADATTALANTYTSLGYISEDGATNSNSPESESVRAWGGYDVMTSMTGRPDTWSFKLIEALNVDVLKEIYGSANVTGTLTGSTGVKVSAKPEDTGDRVWVIDMIMRGGVAKRVVIPDGHISEIGEIVYNDTEAIGYEITITAMPDGNGNTHYEYIKAPTTSGGPT